MIVLLSGGAGYFGSVLTGELLRHGYKVDVVDRLNYGDAGVRPYVGLANYCFHDYDIRDLYYMRRMAKDADFIIHLAALVGESLCDKYPEETWGVNVEGTRGLVEVAEENHVPFIQASTCSNYGVTEGVATEETPLNPKGLYAESKVEAEKAVGKLANHIIFRFATLYGVSPRMRLDLMLNEWTMNMIRDGSIKIYQPEAYRPIFNVSDASKVIRTTIDNYLDFESGTYNVGVNEYNFTKRQIAEIIRGELGGRIEYVDRGDPRSYRVSFDKISKAMYLTPTVPPSAGVNLVKHFLDGNPDASKCINERAYLD